MGWRTSRLLPAVFMSFKDTVLVAVMAVHVDDGLMAGHPTLAKPVFDQMQATFE